MFTVLGSGFGLYGYLPALLESGHDVALPVRYRSAVSGRPELARYVREVVWCSDVDEALGASSGVAVALRPQDQALWVPRLTQVRSIGQLILEKPIAPTPESAASLLAEVENAAKRYRVGYTFRFTPWAARLTSALAEKTERISFVWNFMAHHYRTDVVNWKRLTSTGGGAVRFYGIHVIALLAELGYDDVSASTVAGATDDEIQRWQATFTGPDLCPFTLSIDSREANASFSITAYTGRVAAPLARQPDPFSSSDSGEVEGQDARVGVLRQLCDSFSAGDDGHAERQRAIVALWKVVETKSRRVPLLQAEG